jgi:hypothetical protein
MCLRSLIAHFQPHLRGKATFVLMPKAGITWGIDVERGGQFFNNYVWWDCRTRDNEGTSETVHTINGNKTPI